ncbi:tigger transposable element-derived protein 1-like [Topomyia yanbarensis]|uniref:tigger transposable element-derived protein 1-like n=1 Tax=Topomyia yanbarensis TaxID=2498891 RepID=UPI00273C1F79|nr:tigger transposable element-derived protein 1-like [Topomyia yanbarensis]
MDFGKLPVHWTSNAKAWVTQEIFRRWLEECFVPEVKVYLLEKGLEFRVLLIIDNAPGHLRVEHPNVKIVFLPPNTTSLIRPLDQGIIATFKRYFIKTTFRFILDQVDTAKAMSIIEAWKFFTMRECVAFIDVAEQQLRKSTLNACWKPLWPDCVQSSLPVGDEEGEILLLAHAIGGEGFNDFCSADIDEMTQEPFFDDDDLLDYINDSTSTINEEKEFTESKVEEGLQLGEQLADFFLTHDPCVERAVSFRNDLKYCLLRYTELVKAGKKASDDLQLNDEEKNSHGNPLKRKRARVIYDSD